MTTPERYRQIKELYHRACDLEASERARFLAETCGEDEALRAELERLLAGEAGGVTERLRAPIAAEAEKGAGAASVPAAFPERIGAYRILRLLGQGGMGAVYEAEQDRPHRLVAIKLMRPGVASDRALRRFEHEAELLGRLQHPGIAQIHEAGLHEGVPFFAMEFVDGPTLTTFAAARDLGTPERLQLFARVCEAVHHAHTRGIVHRDLKPANILVAELGDPPEPQPKVLDFGIARATDSDRTIATRQTEVGQVLGTLPYMSPEQVAGDADIDPRSDVYALGVVLYELLAGRLPYDLERRALAEAARVIREEEPTRLSSIDARFRGDIETIVGKALEKDPGRRYPSALDLASDLRRHLDDEPITARPPSTWYQLHKFARRNRGLVGGVAAAFAVLVLGLIGTTYGLAQAVEARATAEVNEQRAIDESERAEEEARRASAAKEDARQRAEELQQVASFQAEQLGKIDVPLMGVRLRESLVEKRRSALKARGADETTIEAALEDLDKALTGINFADTALEALDHNILEGTLNEVEKKFQKQPLVKARLLQALAKSLSELGLLERAVAPQTEALEIRRNELGDDHPETLNAVHSMGALLMRQGKLADAEVYLRNAFEGYRRMLGGEHPDTLTSCSDIGVLFKHMGRLVEAQQHFNESLETRRRVLGEAHADTLASLHNMGALFMDLGVFAEAEQYFGEALEARRQVLGDAHRDTLTSMHTMGQLLAQQGEYAEAESYLEEALEIRRRVLGDNHPDTLGSVNSIAVLLALQGKYAEAEPYYREGLEGFRRVLGDAHPNTLVAINNMGELLRVQGRPAEAEPYIREALEHRRRLLGTEHLDTIYSINSLAVILRDQGRFTEAEAYAQEALDVRRRVLGSEHPDAIASIIVIGVMFLDQDRLSEAEPYLSEALQVSRRALGNEHPRTLYAISNMGCLLRAQGRRADAEPYFREAFETRRRVLGDAHPDTLISLNNLGALLRDLGRLAEAEAMLR